MIRIFWILVVSAALCGLAGCRTQHRQPPPDYGQVQENHDESQQDLQNEEDQSNNDSDS